MKPRLVLLASYPKSGNTWLRLVLNNMLRNDDQPVSINDMYISRYSDRRWLFDYYAPWPGSDLSDEEIDNLWPDVYRQFNADGDQPELLKCHSSALTNRKGELLFPPEVTKVVLHLVRHPFDVAVSLANHFGWTVEEAVEKMTSLAIIKKEPESGLSPRLHQHWGNWLQHYTSWRYAARTHHVITMRYEDLLANPYAHFLTLTRSAVVNFDEQALVKALEGTRFESLQKQEIENGFRERLPQSKQFFRAGRSGTWQGFLSDTMRQKLIMSFEDAMNHLGYGKMGEIYSNPNFV